MDGLRCEVYLQDRAGVVRFVLAFYAIGGNLPEGAEESLDESLDVAETRVWVCEDGYLHQIKMQVTGSDLTIDGHFKLADLNGDIKIVAPPNPIVPPSSTPVPSETPVWTATPRATLSAAQATATATAALDALDATTDWEVVLADTFDSNSNNWTVEEGKSIENGKYHMEYERPRQHLSRFTGNCGADRFRASIDARLVGGSQDCGMGLTFRNGIDDISGGMTDYVFYIQNDGSWGFDIIHSPDPGIAQTGTSDAIVPRALNRLQVLAQGNQLTFFVNGKFVGQAEDDTLPIGKAGAAVWVLGPGGCEVEFDNFQVSTGTAPGLYNQAGKNYLYRLDGCQSKRMANRKLSKRGRRRHPRDCRYKIRLGSIQLFRIGGCGHSRHGAGDGL